MKSDAVRNEAPSPSRPYRMTTRAEAAALTGRRIIEAAEALFTERPYGEVTLQAIAERAGVTPQTVIRRYGSKDGLLRTATEEKAVEIQRSRTPADPSDRREALRLLLSSYEEMGDLGWRALCQEEGFPEIQEMLERARQSHRNWIEECFGELLASAEGPERERRITLLFAATDLYLWKLFRRDLGLDRDSTLLRMEELLEAVVRDVPFTHRAREDEP